MDELRQKEALFVAACKYIKDLEGKNAVLEDKNARLHSLLQSVTDGYNTITIGDIIYCKACYKEVSTEGEEEEEHTRIGECDWCGELVCRECFDIYTEKQHPVCPLCVGLASAECNKCGTTRSRHDILHDPTCPVCKELDDLTGLLGGKAE